MTNASMLPMVEFVNVVILLLNLLIVCIVAFQGMKLVKLKVCINNDKNPWHSFPLTLLDDKIISCENGQAIPTHGGFCKDSQECPIITSYGIMALTSNCGHVSNHFCPISRGLSKICIDKVNVSITDYCTEGGHDKYWKCPKANKGLVFEQCFDM